MDDVLETIKKIESSYDASKKIYNTMLADRCKLAKTLKENEHPWMGKLCWFSNQKEELGTGTIGILKRFYPSSLAGGSGAYSDGIRTYALCRAVKASELKDVLAEEE